MLASPAPCSAEANLGAALVLLQRLQRLGLRRLVLCPGSRSAPLAVAAGLLAGPELDLLTAVDERSAAFLALGLGRADGLPAAVVTTSGTAVANLLPAVVEADFGAVPLLLLTADRPVRLKHCGANQTVNQEAFLAPSCRRVVEADPRGLAAMEASALAELADRAWNGCLLAPLGPVHLNLPFEEPLHASPAEIAAVRARLIANAPVAPLPPAGSPTTVGPEVSAAADGAAWDGLDPDRPGVVVAGPWRGTAEQLAAMAAALMRLQRRTGWPVLADALSGLRGWPGLELVHGYDLLLEAPGGCPSAEQLLRLGSMPASRRLQRWLAACSGPQLLISHRDPRNLDASGTATARRGEGLEPWLAKLPAAALEAAPAGASLEQARRWITADQQLQALLDQALPARGAATEPALARALSRLLPPGIPLMLASSSPVRDWESFAASDACHRPVFGFRGASGIDGTLSIAAGLARSCGRLVLLSGDLALLHDANGWLWQQQLRQRGVQLTVVLVENGGGGIFEQLPIRLPPAEPTLLDFERLFAMPQAIDHCALAAAHGVPSRRLSLLEDLAAALDWAAAEPIALVEVRTGREGDAALRQQLRRRMASDR